MPEETTITESTPESPKAELTLDETAPDYKAEAVSALSAWIAEGEARLAALSDVPGHLHLGMARGSFACALAIVRNDLALVGGTH